jgi:protein transport protein SEC24
MTVRTSTGIILFDYYTGSGKISVRDLELSSLNSD